MPAAPEDIDARFLLANERTLLAWVRTSLTMLAVGVGAIQLIEDEWRVLAGLSLLVLGGVAAVLGVVRFRRADSALRRGEPPPRSASPWLIAAGVAVIALVLIVASIASEIA